MAQLNQMQRYAIFLYLKEEKTQAYIAGQLTVSKSTISRELKRNGGKRGYSWKQAQEQCDMRKERLREPRKMCGKDACGAANCIDPPGSKKATRCNCDKKAML